MKHIKEKLNISRFTKPDNIIPQGLPIRRSGKPTRLYIDNEYFANGYSTSFFNTTTLVYCVLAKYANAKTQKCFPSWNTIIRETGIKHRNTITIAIKELESYKIISADRYKGKSNLYTLLDCSIWKPLNSIVNDTRLSATSINDEPNRYQNENIGSINADTLNHIKKSDKEMDLINFSKEIKEPGTNSKKGAFPILKGFFRDQDIEEAAEFLKEKGINPSAINAKNTLKQWAKEGKIKPVKEMSW